MDDTRDFIVEFVLAELCVSSGWQRCGLLYIASWVCPRLDTATGQDERGGATAGNLIQNRSQCPGVGRRHSLQYITKERKYKDYAQNGPTKKIFLVN